ncbi:MAG: methyl-accepting chemotaxis protein [Bacteriovoracaceae bacterium]|nr:methyl-accepting chemotaxis protein [Bacteriovoracaceae bacterium]
MAPNLRNIYLIDSRFQLKYSFYVCVLIFLSSIIYPYTIFELLSYFIDFTAKNIHKLPELKSLNQSLEDKRNNLIIILVLWQLGFTALAFLVNIFLTHKIVGPLFKLKNFFLAIADGKDNGKLYFRNGDYFPDIAVSYNNAMDKLKEDRKNDFVYLNEVSAYLNNLNQVVPDDKKVVLQEIVNKLDEIQKDFQNQA